MHGFVTCGFRAWHDRMLSKLGKAFLLCLLLPMLSKMCTSARF